MALGIGRAACCGSVGGPGQFGDYLVLHGSHPRQQMGPGRDVVCRAAKLILVADFRIGRAVVARFASGHTHQNITLSHGGQPAQQIGQRISDHLHA